MYKIVIELTKCDKWSCWERVLEKIKDRMTILWLNLTYIPSGQ